MHSTGPYDHHYPIYPTSKRVVRYFGKIKIALIYPLGEITIYMGDDGNDEIFSTRELALAAALTVCKHDKVGFDLQFEGRRNLPVGYFKFTATPAMHEDVNKYWKRELMVEVQAFHAAIRSLKSEVTDAINK